MQRLSQLFGSAFGVFRVTQLRRVVLMAILASSLAVAGCTLSMCNDEIDPNGRYQVTIVEAYDGKTTFKGNRLSDTRPTCPTSDGLADGTKLEVEGKDTASGTACKAVVAKITRTPPEVVLLGQPVTQLGMNVVKGGGSGFMVAVEHVTLPAGDGDLSLEFRAGGAAGGIFATPVSGDLPPVVLFRTFFPTPDPFQRCYDEFVVQLVKE